MNLYRHINVLSRGRAIVAAGLLVAIAMAMLACFKVSLDGGPKLTWRKPETWSSQTKLMITQPGFPEGRSVLPGSVDGATQKGDQFQQPVDEKGKKIDFADPSRFAYLAWIYAHFLMGDEVRTMIQHRPPGMLILADPLTAGGNLSAATLPLIALTTQAETKTDALRLNSEVSQALEGYLHRQQQQTQTPTSDRVVVSTVDRTDPVLIKGHSPDLGVIAFLMVMAAALSLVYIRENLRVQKREAEAAAATDFPFDQGQERIVDFDAESPFAGAPKTRTERSVR
jgi:hypothetical protein